MSPKGKKKNKKKKKLAPSFLDRTSAIAAIVIPSLAVIFTGVGIFVSHEDKVADKQPASSFSCPIERQRAMDYHKANPNSHVPYNGQIEDQCQLNEVVAEPGNVPAPPAVGGGGSTVGPGG
jgi:hypothetical protein